VSFRYTDANAAAPVSDFAATINWGDGSSSAGVVTAAGGGAFVVSGTHTYAAGSSGHAITVSVADRGGSTTTATTPAATAALTPARKGGPHAFTVVATCSSGTPSAALNGIA